MVDAYLEGDLTRAREDVRPFWRFSGAPLLERYYDSSARRPAACSRDQERHVDPGRSPWTKASWQRRANAGRAVARVRRSHGAGGRRVTLRQILTMTAGLPQTPQDPIPSLSKPPTIGSPRSCPAGSTAAWGGFAYASAGSHLLSAILVEATVARCWTTRGEAVQPAGHQYRSRRGAPAVIENLPVYQAAAFAWPVDPQGLHLGHTYLKINAPDMAKIGQLMLHNGRWDGEQIVSTQWVTESTRAQVATSAGAKATTGTSGGHHRQQFRAFAPPASAVSSSRSSPPSISSSWFPPRSQTSHALTAVPSSPSVDQQIAPALTP